MADKSHTLRETDDEARTTARILVRSARYMAIAVIDPETSYPSASRVLTATDLDGTPVILVSGLSTHTKALLSDARCSLLAGEPGKGDPLAHPRVTVQSDAQPVERDSPAHDRIRQRFLDRHPKAELYIDFPDFCFFRLAPVAASLNGGFGRAYSLPGSDLLIPNLVPDIIDSGEEWCALQKRLKSMTDEANDLAEKLGVAADHQWRFGGIDPAGVDLIAGNVQHRHEFRSFCYSAQDAEDYISRLANV
jgi:putative heme iron utilization protein